MHGDTEIELLFIAMKMVRFVSGRVGMKDVIRRYLSAERSPIHSVLFELTTGGDQPTFDDKIWYISTDNLLTISSVVRKSLIKNSKQTMCAVYLSHMLYGVLLGNDVMS
jgi:hypothetical protein